MLGDLIDPNHQAWDLPACSVDREKYLRAPIFAVLPSAYGYAQCRVTDLPPPVISPGGGIWEAKPVHLPVSEVVETSVPENRAHSEVRLHKDGVFVEGKCPGAVQKKQWKNEFSQAFIVVVKPKDLT